MKVVVAGATGLTGGFLINELENDSDFESVVALTRNSRKDSGKTRWKVVDYEDTEALKEITEGVDIVFCCLGTTIKKAGSQEAFYKVDYEYVINLARAARSNNVRQFSVMSSIGADSKSKIFYSRVKGGMEDTLRGLGFDELIIFNPSLLLGPRAERRLGERIGVFFGKLFSSLLFGKMKNYHPIHVSNIAKAMISEAKTVKNRISTLVYSDIIKKSKT